MSAGRTMPVIRFRRPTEADHRRIVGLVDEWWGGRRLHDYLPRLWFQHFTGTSWMAETEDGRPAGFLVGFISPEHPDEAYIHMVGANPNLRRRGIGAALYDRFFDDMRGRGVRRVSAITWPGNRASSATSASYTRRWRGGWWCGRSGGRSVTIGTGRP